MAKAENTTKIVILGKPGGAINGKNAFLEVNGHAVYGEKLLTINCEPGEVATATVTIILPSIEYRNPDG